MNAVRELVANRLKENLGEDWWEKGTTTGIRDRVGKRKTKEAVRPAAKARSRMPTSATSSMATNNWALFEDLFPDQDWVRTRLADLEMSRNVIAHNGVLNGREITRITLYLKDWVMQVG